MAWKIKKGDHVVLLCGRDKGYTGKVLRVLREEERVIVQGAAMRVRHLRPSMQNPEGGKVTKESPVHISNVALVDPETQKPTRVGFKFDDKGSKVRYAKRSGRVIEG